MSEQPLNDESFEFHVGPNEPGEEFEEISSEEVDRIVDALEQLIESTDGENIKTYLEEAAANVYFLIYDEEESEAA